MTDTKKFRPFSNGTEMMIWLDLNCDRCKKLEPQTADLKTTGCKGEYYIALGAATDGTIPDEIAEWIGKDKNGYELKAICKHFKGEWHDKV